MPVSPSTSPPPRHRTGPRGSDGPLLLGLDVGTTTCKAAVFALSNPSTPLSVGRAPSATRSPRPGWSEADPDEVFDRVLECTREALSNVDASRVAAIGISGTACGAWLIDDKHTPVRPAILWNDGRAASIVDTWQSDGTLGEIFDRSGNVMFPGYTLPVLRWLHEHERRSLEAARAVLCCKDWIRLQLTGEVATDETDASYVPFLIDERRWDSRMLELAGIQDYQRLLPDIAPAKSTSPLKHAVADDLGLKRGIPVAVGATDIIAGLVGAGATAPGQAVTILGTSANSSLITATPEFEPRRVGIMAAAPLGYYARTMINTSGSTTLDWMAALIADKDVGTLLDLADTASPVSAPVLVPYLSNAGVVSPFVDAHARGTLAGLRVEHGPADLARAAIVGLGFAVADSYQSMTTRVQELTAIGGAARSDLLLQVISSAVGADVIRPSGEEFGARGVALLAARAAGLVNDHGFRSAAARLDVERRFAPSPGTLDEELDRYRRVRDTNRPLGRAW